MLDCQDGLSSLHYSMAIYILHKKVQRHAEEWNGVEEFCFDQSSVYAHSEYRYAIMMFGGFQVTFGRTTAQPIRNRAGACIAR
jgi:hypothetical protein